MPSFDVVSRTNIPEIDNALNGVKREATQRYDLKNTMCSIERTGDSVTIIADNDMLLRQMHELLDSYCSRRGVDTQVLDFKMPYNAAKGSLRQEGMIRQGIDDTTGRQIVSAVKASKLKVQVTIQGDELHVTGKKRDVLQQTIELLKEMKIDVPLQYVNFRD